MLLLTSNNRPKNINILNESLMKLNKTLGGVGGGGRLTSVFQIHYSLLDGFTWSHTYFAAYQRANENR